MEILAGILAFIKLIDALLDVKDKILVDRREEISSICLEISQLIRSIAEDLSNGIYPAGKCAQMDYLMNQLEKTLEGKIDNTLRGNMLQWMMIAVNVERMLGELSNLSDDKKQKNIDCLNEVSGKFAALSTLAKIKI